VHFQDFLLKELGTLPSNIVFLANKEATRESIFGSFRRHFIENRNIRWGDPIIFFFSGAGYLVQAPGDVSTGDQQVQLISPWNEGGEDHGRYIHGIPLYVLEWMVRELAATKGNNIVRHGALH